MWICPSCERSFKTNNQSHSCTQIDMGALFLGKPDALVLILDEILQRTASWSPNSVGTATHSIVFTSQKAWLILKPMSKEMDVKFYAKEPIESGRFKKVNPWGKKYAHHIRLQHPDQVDRELMELLEQGFRYSLI